MVMALMQEDMFPIFAQRHVVLNRSSPAKNYTSNISIELTVKFMYLTSPTICR